MADSADAKEIYLVEPIMRGIIPLDQFKPSRSMRRAINRNAYQIRTDTAFKTTMENCAKRETTWINRQIIDLYCTLFDMGHAHSVEVWEEKEMVGGLYGVSLGRAFFGESMFSFRTNASKLALCHLVTLLKQNGYRLLDTQFITPHLASMGGIEIPQKKYLQLLKKALTD